MHSDGGREFVARVNFSKHATLMTCQDGRGVSCVQVRLASVAYPITAEK